MKTFFTRKGTAKNTSLSPIVILTAKNLFDTSLLVSLILFSGFFYGQSLTVAEALKKNSTGNVEERGKDDQADLLAASSQPLVSVNSEYYQEPVASEAGDGRNEYLMLWLNLILIMGVFCGGAYFLLRYLKKKGMTQGEESRHFFQNLARFPLGVNKSIQIVKILNQYYILACGQEEVVFLSKVEDKESIDMLNLESSSRQDQGFFESSLKNYMNIGGWSPLNVTKNLKNRVKGLQ